MQWGTDWDTRDTAAEGRYQQFEGSPLPLHFSSSPFPLQLLIPISSSPPPASILHSLADSSVVSSAVLAPSSARLLLASSGDALYASQSSNPASYFPMGTLSPVPTRLSIKPTVSRALSAGTLSSPALGAASPEVGPGGLETSLTMDFEETFGGMPILAVATSESELRRGFSLRVERIKRSGADFGCAYAWYQCTGRSRSSVSITSGTRTVTRRIEAVWSRLSEERRRGEGRCRRGEGRSSLRRGPSEEEGLSFVLMLSLVFTYL